MSITINNLIRELGKLPGIGEKTATRLAFFILRQPPQYAQGLAQALLDVKEKIKLCSVCLNLTECDPCEICSDPKRDSSIICVVEDPTDVLAIEKIHQFHGKYHILHGAISPLDGIGPDDIKIRELIRRLENSQVREVIVATNASVEGETTALYLSKVLTPLGIKLTRLASGVPIGSDLEYVDVSTLSRAFEARRQL
jgi:recombination protein RecR